MKKVWLILLLFTYLPVVAQEDKQQLLDALKKSGYIRQEGNHIIFKVKKASDTPQIRLLYGNLFASDKYTIGFEVDGKYFGKKPPLSPDNKPVIKHQDKPVLASAPQTRTVSAAPLASADEVYLQTGTFLIRSMTAYLYLVRTESRFLRANVYPWGGSKHWSFVRKEGGKVLIRNEEGECLEQSGKTTLLTRFANGLPGQLWELEPAPHSYRIKANNGLYLTVQSTDFFDTSTVTLALPKNETSDEAYNQRWHLIKMTDDRRKMTAFDAVVNGYEFVNDFKGEDFARWGGLCGGMIYSVLDYYYSGKTKPDQDYPPANQTTLQSYIYNRHWHSYWNVTERWTELEGGFNVRANEFFRWGLEGKAGGRQQEFRAAIDAGKPVPLGMFCGGRKSQDGIEIGNHVVLGLGYAMGRHDGTVEGHAEDYKLFVYDPNEGNRVITLVPDMRNNCFFEVETGTAWLTYFVNNKYEKNTPPDITNYPEDEPDGSIRNLYATFRTGGDDLRGGNDNVHLIIRYTDGSEQKFENINQKARWVDNSNQTVHLGLNRAVRSGDIREFVLQTTFGNDPASDDWNLDYFIVANRFYYPEIIFAEKGRKYEPTLVFRFSGDAGNQKFTVPALTGISR